MTKKQSKSKDKEEIIDNNEVVDNDTQEVNASDEAGSEESASSAGDACQELNTELEVKLEQLEKEILEAKDKHLRLIAEYDNYRKRTLKEKIELSKTAGEKVIVGILPVIDDFDRALQHLDKASDLDAVKDGISLIYNKFINFLGQQGVKEIETTNQDFNADLHEAITKVPAPDETLKGKILDCVQKGYFLDEKVIRYPQVVIGE
jgi:molecular chaperone GrpE